MPAPPAMMAQGPPSAPPEAPTLSAFPMGQGAPSAHQSGAIPRLFFTVEQTLDTIAQAIPGSSREIDGIKQELRAVLANALQGQGPSTAAPVMPREGANF